MSRNVSNGGPMERKGSALPRVSRRQVLKAAIATGVTLGLSEVLANAQSSPPPTKGARPPATVTPVAEREGVVAPMAARGELPEQTIVLAMFSGPEADAHKRLSPKFQEYTKGKVKLVVEDLGRGSVANEKWMTVLMSKSDTWDVLWVRSFNIPLAVEAGFMAPLKQLRADPNLFNAKAFDLEDYPKAVQNMFSYKGDPYGHPQEVVVFLVCYRKDLLDKYGLKYPPDTGWTLEEMRDLCLTLKGKLKADNQPADVYPLLIPLKKGGHASHSAMMAILGNGVTWFDEKTQTPKLYQPGSVEAVQFVYDLVHKHQVASPGVVDYEYAETLTAFQQGKAVLDIQGNAAGPTFNNPSVSPVLAGKVGYTMYPAFKKTDSKFPHGYSMAHGIGVSAFSKKQKAAFEYITWFNSREIARDCVVNGGGIIGRTSVLSDPAIQQKAPHIKACLNHSKIIYPMPATPELQWMTYTCIDTHMNTVWTKMKSIEDGLKNADREIIAHYKDKGYIK